MTVKTVIATGVLAVCATTALAHATLEVKEAAIGSTYEGTMRIGHGCDGQPTLSVSIEIPDGVIGVAATPKPGWTVETRIGPYAQTHSLNGALVSEGVREIVWTGSLDSHAHDSFGFAGTIVKTLDVGSTLYFPTVQSCADGTADWVNIPADGQDPKDIDGPAPALTLIKGD